MARKTPAVATQVIEPFIGSNARFKRRLIDFDTGKADLEGQHRAWLRESIELARVNSGFHVRVFGFASKLGDARFNKALSLRRMNAVLSFLQGIEPRTLSNIELWEARGEEDSTGKENDNSPQWRAVEVHLFVGPIPPSPVPPGATPISPTVIPLPGGPRFSQWAVAAPGGTFIAAGVGGGFNIFFIRNEKMKDTRGYIQPVAGAGVSVGLSGLKTAWRVVQQIVTGVQISAPSFVAVTSKHPVTWEEMEGCLVQVKSLGAGLVKGFTAALITFHASGVYQHGPSGVPIRVAEDLFQFRSVGENWQIGAGGSVAVGPLVRVG